MTSSPTVGDPTGTPAPSEIVAITVYPGQARITRRASTRLEPGTRTVVFDNLPTTVQDDSVRVSGRGPATVAAVDLRTSWQATHPDESRAGQLDDELRTLSAQLDELTDRLTVLEAQVAATRALAAATSGSFARELARGRLQPATVGEVNTALAQQVSGLLDQGRPLKVERTRLESERARVEREIAALAPVSVDRRQVLVTLDVAPADHQVAVELDLTYLVSGASWQPRYDVRLLEGALHVDWFAMVTNSCGEDWPACELRLSTARPTGTLEIPELDPWYLREYTPPRPPMPYGAAMPAPGAPQGAPMMARAMAADLAMEVATASAMPAAKTTVEHGLTASTYSVHRPSEIPDDGEPHQVLITGLQLPARLDHVTAPLLSDDVVVRVVATNSSEHTLRAGRAALFHGQEFVGGTHLDVWAPGEEVELSLGLDDRVRVTRDLVHRSVAKARLGANRRHEARYRITVGNYSPGRVDVTVLDQLPVARSAEIVVRDVHLHPKPAEVTDLGVVTWKLGLDPGQQAELGIGFSVDVGKNITLDGWRE